MARVLCSHLVVLSGAALLLAGTACQPTHPNCENDAHCSEKREVCVNGLCQQCRGDANCGPCQTCNAGRCQVVVGCCQKDGDCSVGQRCRDGRCGPECAGDAECGAGNRCSQGRCIPGVECTGAGDCAAGTRCVNGRCVKPVGSRGSVAAGRCDLVRIHFEFDSAEVRPSAAATLEDNAACLKQLGTPAITVEGHCDDRGTEEYNLALGERRARSARAYLERLGVSGSRVVSYGENRPLEPRADETAHSSNRRAEFVIR